MPYGPSIAMRRQLLPPRLARQQRGADLVDT